MARRSINDRYFYPFLCDKLRLPMVFNNKVSSEVIGSLKNDLLNILIEAESFFCDSSFYEDRLSLFSKYQFNYSENPRLKKKQEDFVNSLMTSSQEMLKYHKTNRTGSSIQ